MALGLPDAHPQKPPAGWGRGWQTGCVKSFPVETRYLPLVRCELCRKQIPYQPGKVSAVLTAHYEREHADVLTKTAD